MMVRFILLLAASFLLWTSPGDAVNASSALVQPLEYEAEQTETSARGLREDLHDHLKVWLPQSFPDPAFTDPPICRNGRICDPDSVLTLEEMDSLAILVLNFEKTQSVNCSASAKESSNKTDAVTAIPVQLAIAMVQKMNLIPFGYSDDPQSEAAKFFCRSLHDMWGVGYNVPSCGGGTGIVIFFSVLDRALYISRGGALDKVLTNARLDRIINRNMKPRFREHRYCDGLKEAVDQIGVYVQQGPPSLKERLARYWLCYIILLVFGLVFAVLRLLHIWDVWKRRQERQQYARVADQLSQLDRAKAEALQGKYNTTSCPICLEAFKAKPPTDSNSALHKWGVESTTPLTATHPIHAKHNYDALAPPSSKLGSDGLPLALLRCGHVFDETCWAKWVSKASSPTICPICQQDVGVARLCTTASKQDHECSSREQPHEGVLRQYQLELSFRLHRLRSRYPEFIQSYQIQSWTGSTYQGAMVRDSDFVSRAPPCATFSSYDWNYGPSFGGNYSSSIFSGGSSSFGGGSSSFGGGFSSGGQGGTW